MREISKQHETNNLHYQVYMYGDGPHGTLKNKIDHKQKLMMCKRSENMRVGVMLQTGTWDLSVRSLKQTLNEVLPSLNNSLRQLRIQQSKFLKMLVIGPPPYNSAQEISAGRSNDEIAIFDSRLMKNCKGKTNFPITVCLARCFCDTETASRTRVIILFALKLMIVRVILGN